MWVVRNLYLSLVGRSPTDCLLDGRLRVGLLTTLVIKWLWIRLRPLIGFSLEYPADFSSLHFPALGRSYVYSWIFFHIVQAHLWLAVSVRKDISGRSTASTERGEGPKIWRSNSFRVSKSCITRTYTDLTERALRLIFFVLVRNTTFLGRITHSPFPWRETAMLHHELLPHEDRGWRG